MGLRKAGITPKFIFTVLLVAWIVKVFLSSLPYKFTASEHTQHIFGTIGQWLEGFLGSAIGNGFANYAGYIIGIGELLVSIILLLPLIAWIGKKTKKFQLNVDSCDMFTIGGLGASALMGGAIFFHLFSRLGIEVLDDGGALFYTAVSVFVSGIMLFLLHRLGENENSFLRSITPRSWKHWLFWVELVPAIFLLIIGSFLGFYAHQANTDRYPSLEIAEVPEFSRIVLPFSHKYAIEPSLPFFASAIIDVDNDGTEEIFLGGGLDQADVVYSYVDGDFVDVSSKHNLGNEKHPETFGASVLDVDRNGWDDIIIAREDDVYISYNEKGVFREEKLGLVFNEKSTPLSVALGDINKDGWLDMYVATYIKNSFVEGQTIFNDDTYGSSSLLFLNNGDNTFTDITESSGMSYIHNTFQGNFLDLDNDQDVDLIVSHDTGQVRTWRNNGDNTFTNMANPTSTQFGYFMGNGIGDYDNDGLVDLAFSNIGNVGPLNNIVKGDLTPDQDYNPKILLLKNNGDFTFTDISQQAKVANYEFAWGMTLEDFNADTRQDLLISQNYVQLPYNRLIYLPGRFLLQAENGEFTDREKESNVVNKAFEIASLTADFNGDGALDIVRANLQGQSVVQMNQGISNNYLKLKLPNTVDSLGAVARVTLASGEVLTKHFVTGEGLCSDSSHVLYFGLGKQESVSNMTVTYISGEIKEIENIEINSTITL